MGEEGYFNQASFNQAGFQMYRVHQIMSQINLCWVSLTGETDGSPNHLVLFNCLVGLFLELKPSFTDKEGNEVDEQLEVLEQIINTNSLWVDEDSHSISGRRNSKALNLAYYNVLRKELRAFQSLILKYAGNHGLLNPSKSDPRRSIIE